MIPPQALQPIAAPSPPLCPAAPPANALQLAQHAVSGLSANTQRAYTRVITSYLAAGHAVTREGVQAYLASITASGSGSVTRNVALAALKLFARECEVRGLLDRNELHAIERVKSARVLGQRLGHWTDEDGVRKLLEACRDARERALIAIMCGCGLRRSEVSSLRWEQYQAHYVRKVLCDIVGKGGRLRSVAVPTWAAELIDEYLATMEGSDDGTDNDNSNA